MGFVGASKVVVVVVVVDPVPVPVVVVVSSATDVPVRNALTNFNAFSVPPARFVKFAAILVVTWVWPAFAVVVVVVVAACATATGASAMRMELASIRIVRFM